MEKYHIIFNAIETDAARETAEHFIAQGHIVRDWSAMPEERKEFFLKEGVDLLILSLPNPSCEEGSFGDLNYSLLSDNLWGNVQPLYDLLDRITVHMESSRLRRIAYLTDKACSIRETEDRGRFSYHMAGSANHMMMKILFNTLRPKGFTFRCYAWEPSAPGIPAWKYILRDKSYIAIEPPHHNDENRLVMRDSMLREISW